jgi:hypothetical protein
MVNYISKGYTWVGCESERGLRFDVVLLIFSPGIFLTKMNNQIKIGNYTILNSIGAGTFGKVKCKGSTNQWPSIATPDTK